MLKRYRSGEADSPATISGRGSCQVLVLIWPASRIRNHVNIDEPVEKPIKPDAAQEATAVTVITAGPTRPRRAWVFQGYLVTAAIAFGVLAALASVTNYFPLDLSITRGVQTIQAPMFAHFMWLVSFVGYAPQVTWMTGIIITLLFITGVRWEAVMALIAAIGVSAAGDSLKLIVHRPRPTADLVLVAQQLDSHSFPSGHVLL